MHLNNLHIWCFLLGLCWGLMACTNSKPPADANGTTTVVDYRLDAPTQVFKLSKNLREISGLTLYQDQFLCAVQDERGNLYQLSLEDGTVQHKVDFSADGDYEGLAVHEEHLYALRADGVLFKLLDWQDQKKATTEVINTNLGEINDTEGLTYDPRTNQLWIACKGSALIGQQVNQARGIYAYDLTLDSFFTAPIFTLSRKQLQRYNKSMLKGTPDYGYYKKLLKKAKPDMPLRPSAIAIHPLTSDIYLLCAVGHTLVVLRRDFSIRRLYRLSETLFEQPEGMTFDSKGNLYIASEGVKKKARVFYFPYRKAS